MPEKVTGVGHHTNQHPPSTVVEGGCWCRFATGLVRIGVVDDRDSG
jgi:hypothetical protein